MKPKRKTRIIQEIIRPLKTKQLFSVSFKMGSKTIYLGDFNTIEQAHKEFQEIVKFYFSGKESSFVIENNNQFDYFDFQSKHLLSNNKTGYVGVVQTRNGKFRARIRIQGKTGSLGVFETPQKAHEFYMRAKYEINLKPYYYSISSLIRKLNQPK